MKLNLYNPADKPVWLVITTYAVTVAVALILMLGWYWSRTPDVFWVQQQPADGSRVVGYATADTLVRVADTLLDKPGG